jgi:CheY-like chemotaxis protein
VSNVTEKTRKIGHAIACSPAYAIRRHTNPARYLNAFAIRAGVRVVSQKAMSENCRFPVTPLTIPHLDEVPATMDDDAVETKEHAAHILVVDDNVDTARGLARLLELMGHDIRTAYDGLEAVAVALTFRPQYVLLDIGLPGLDGYEVAKRLRGEGFHNAIIIAITGRGQPEDLRRSREAGFNHHLVKPIEYNALVALIGQPVP